MGAGFGQNTVSSGFDGPWTRTPSRWSYDFFEAMLEETWEPVKSAYGMDQWWTVNRSSPYARTRRLTADISLVEDGTYKPVALEYARNRTQFDSDFADAWYKLVHRSADHPHEDDLENDAGVCTSFEFLEEGFVSESQDSTPLSGSRDSTPFGVWFIGLTLCIANSLSG